MKYPEILKEKYRNLHGSRPEGQQCPCNKHFPYILYLNFFFKSMRKVWQSNGKGLKLFLPIVSCTSADKPVEYMITVSGDILIPWINIIIIIIIIIIVIIIHKSVSCLIYM